MQVQVSRNDRASYGDDPFLMTKLVVSGIAVLVLLLSALGLVNVAGAVGVTASVLVVQSPILRT